MQALKLPIRDLRHWLGTSRQGCLIALGVEKTQLAAVHAALADCSAKPGLGTGETQVGGPLSTRVAHRLLTAAVAGWCGAALDEVAVGRFPSGQPWARVSDSGRRVSVSLTHDDAGCIVALADNGGVGVDLERPDPDRFPPSVAPAMLTPEERELFAAVDPAEQPTWLAQAWTVKEAVLKAAGAGLGVDPSTVGAVPDCMKSLDFLDEDDTLSFATPTGHAVACRRWLGAVSAIAADSRHPSPVWVELLA